MKNSKAVEQGLNIFGDVFRIFRFIFRLLFCSPKYDREMIPACPGSLKTLLFPPLVNNVQNKGTQGEQARYGAELPPCISIVRYPGRPVILGMDFFLDVFKQVL